MFKTEAERKAYRKGCIDMERKLRGRYRQGAKDFNDVNILMKKLAKSNLSDDEFKQFSILAEKLDIRCSDEYINKNKRG